MFSELTVKERLIVQLIRSEARQPVSLCETPETEPAGCA
jgi:hypothetical protein